MFLLITKGLPLRLCHLYNKASSYKYLDTLLNSFENSKSLDVSNIDSVDNYEIYIIELHDADREISLKLKNALAKKNHALIYFIIPKKHTLLLFQLTYLLQTKAIFTESQDVRKIVSKIISDEKAFIRDNLEKWLGYVKMTTQNFLIYKDKKLKYISEGMLTSFECSSDECLKTKVLPQIDIEGALSNEGTYQLKIKNLLNKEENYSLKSLTISDSDMICYLEKEVSTLNADVFSSRFSFIEVLKEKILERDISESDISLLTINIQDTKKLLKDLGIVEFETRFNDLLSFMKSTLNENIIFSQFENNFCVVLFEHISLDDLDVIADNLLTKASTYKKNQEFQVSLDLFSLNLNNREFSEVLSILQSLNNKRYSFTTENQNYIKNVSGRNANISAKDFLNDAYKNNVKLKILNIYHGLVINTSAIIVKISEATIYIKFESLQGIALDNERRTVLQSPSFSQDILAEVKQISLSKKIAVLENFKFLKTNANARKYARVSPSTKTPVAIHAEGKTTNGVMLDLSIKSIAINVKSSSIQAALKKTRVSLVFNLLDHNADNGYVQLNLDANITLLTEIDDTGHYKVICDLEQETHDIDIVLKYVYERQKELIVELKKISKLN